jgi:hypothetical protein
MRSRSRLGAMLAAVLATLAVTALAASAAYATTEGPFYKIAGARLASGATKTVTLSKTEKDTISVPGLGVTITCKMAISAGSKLTGSNGANSSGSEGAITFSNCIVSGNGTPCAVENETFVLSQLKGTLGYSNAARTGKLLELFKPTVGKKITLIKFVGAGCTFSEAEIEGSFIENLGSSTSPVEVGLEKQATNNVMRFQSTVNKIWTESAGALTEVKSSMTFAGINVTFSGEYSLAAEGLPEWGVFTK